MSTPLMELEREILGVLETVSAVNDFRSLNKTINIFFKKHARKTPHHHQLVTEESWQDSESL